MTCATRAASTHSSTSFQQAGSSSSMPVTWWKGIRAGWNTLAISGTGQAAQWASHSPVIAVRSPKRVEPTVIDGRDRREVEDDDRHLGPADHGQHGRRQGIGGHMEEDQIHVGLPETVAGLGGLLRRVDQARG